MVLLVLWVLVAVPDQLWGLCLPQNVIKNPSVRDNITQFIFTNYKKHERPSEAHYNQTQVYVNMHILAISSVDVINMAYNADFYLRQTWSDPRLSWNHISRFSREFSRSISDSSLIHCIWLPDLFFRNGKEGSMYKMTKPNFLLRIKPGGDILYSQKITMRFSCQMHLSNFPMDKQKCNINIGSYGYTLDDLKFIWNLTNPVTQASDMQISEFDTPITINTSDCTGTTKTLTGSYTCLKAIFHLNRQLSSYLVSTYIPAILIVMVSWLSFWISVEAVPARVTLGLLTLLGILTQSKGLSGSLPRVSYIKAIDIYIIACILFIIGALTEFAIASIYYRRQKNASCNKWIRKILKEELKMSFYSKKNRSDSSKKRSKQETTNSTTRRRNIKTYFDNDPIVKTNSHSNYTILSLQPRNRRSSHLYRSKYPSSFLPPTFSARNPVSEEEELRRLLLLDHYKTQQQPLYPSQSRHHHLDHDNDDSRHHDDSRNNDLETDQELYDRLLRFVSSKPDFPDCNELFDSELDCYSRFLFPAFFLLYNCFYWFYSLIISPNGTDSY